MIELVMAVCLMDNPGKCRDVTLNFEGDDVTVRQCAMFGQLEMAKWIGEHPNVTIKKWRCGIAGQVAKL